MQKQILFQSHQKSSSYNHLNHCLLVVGNILTPVCSLYLSLLCCISVQVLTSSLGPHLIIPTIIMLKHQFKAISLPFLCTSGYNQVLGSLKIMVLVISRSLRLHCLKFQEGELAVLISDPMFTYSGAFPPLQFTIFTDLGLGQSVLCSKNNLWPVFLRFVSKHELQI